MLWTVEEGESEREREKEDEQTESKHQRRGSPNKIVVKPASSDWAGLRLRPQINDRDAQDKITSRIKERRYVPIISTYLRDRSYPPVDFRIGVSLSVLFRDTMRSAGPDPPTSK